MPHGIANPLPELHLLTNRQGDFRLWPEADMPLVPANVCFGGMSGHQNEKALFPLLTQSGHQPSQESPDYRHSPEFNRVMGQLKPTMDKLLPIFEARRSQVAKEMGLMGS